jgi:hypothetical protein
MTARAADGHRMKPVLAIGDVHGHYDRLKALLLQEGVIDETNARTDLDVTTVQLGDLGHFGADTSGSDLLCYQAAVDDLWLDVVLWGNHDRAVVDTAKHCFSGYAEPRQETKYLQQALATACRMRLAFEAHGFLLTHAGVHPRIKYNKGMPNEAKTDPVAFAKWVDDHWKDDSAVVDAVSRHRGGSSDVGGILWRDANEKLCSSYRQVFGHTQGDKVRKYDSERGWSYCIDVGTQHNGRLAAIWLPEERIVEVDL